MKAIIFDMDGVLVDTMSSHFQAMKTAVAEVTEIDLDKRTFHLFEGMPIREMAKKILDSVGYKSQNGETTTDILAEKIGVRKKQIFMQTKQIPKPFAGVKELVLESLSGCSKAVVTESSKQELDTIVRNNFGIDAFSVTLNGDKFEGKGKPDPASYLEALRRLGVPATNALIVENAQLGVQAAKGAGVKCIVVLNSSPLTAYDFREFIDDEKDIFKDMNEANGLLKSWCTAVS